MKNSAAEISAQEEASNYVTRGVDALRECREVGKYELVTLYARVVRDMNLYVMVGLRKFVLMVMFFVLRVIC